MKEGGGGRERRERERACVRERRSVCERERSGGGSYCSKAGNPIEINPPIPNSS